MLRRIALVMALVLAGWSPLEARVYRFNYRAVSATGAGTSFRIPQFIIVETVVELPVTDVGEGDLAYADDTDVVYSYDGAAWNAVAGGGGGAPTTASYVTKVAEAGLSNEFPLGSLATGVLLNTTVTGIPTIYSGHTCAANQWLNALSGSAVGTCAQPDFSNLSGSATDAQIPDTITVNQALDLNCTNCIGPTEITDLTLGTDTAGNYVASHATGLGLTGGAAGSEGATLTTSIDYSQTLAGNPALNAKECVFTTSGTSGGGFICESTTADAFEQLWLMPTIADGSDKTNFFAVGDGTTGTAFLATALAANGANCSAGTFPLGVDASGAAESCTSSYNIVQDEGVAAAARDTLNFTGAGVTCGDVGGTVTRCVIPSDAPLTGPKYWTGASDVNLTDENNLGALGTGLVINTAGVPSIYAGNTCTNQFARSDNASGTWTCATVGAADLNATQSRTTLTASATVSDAIIATYTPITGLSFTPAANTNYIIECYIIYTSTAATTGISLAWDTPAGITAIHATGYTTTTATGGTESIVQNADNVATTTANSIITVQNLMRFDARLRNGATSATMSLGITPETANSVSALINSTCQYWTY